MTPYFTKRIQTQNGFVNFYFNRIYTVEGIRYHVSCFDKSSKVYMFNMAEIAGQWLLSHQSKVPQWIKKLGAELETAILESFA